jgi:lysophospholipase L1-like esterase
MIFFRAGGNDINGGKSVDEAFADYKTFVQTIRSKLPDTEIVYISMSPAPKRWEQRDKNKQLNGMIEQYCKENSGLKYCDVYDMTLTPDGKAREELFIADKLHFNAEGYKLLAERVRPFLPAP